MVLKGRATASPLCRGPMGTWRRSGDALALPFQCQNKVKQYSSSSKIQSAASADVVQILHGITFRLAVTLMLAYSYIAKAIDLAFLPMVLDCKITLSIHVVIIIGGFLSVNENL